MQQRPNRSLADSIVEVLAPQSLLLVLDNCEHVLDTTSELVELVLRWCPDVQVLATSREPLGIPAEVVWSVPPLPVPADADEPLDTLVDIASVQLFVERARSAQADFALDDDNRAAVAEICIRLDGVPLALELAAARMRSMSPAQLAERLPGTVPGAGRVTARHRPPPPHAARPGAVVLRAAHAGRAAAVRPPVGVRRLVRARTRRTGVRVRHGIDERDVAGLLGVLVDKSMLVAQDGRFRQLETLREFGRAQLAESPGAGAVRAAHTAVHADLARAAGAGASAAVTRRSG